ncbi:thermonuclease family protein [Enhydrobacter sp.]|jgi:endonuclease YncB( thermonuclease family)|uniref:thermonuclease family protein n=1 Tax=Enhydrobacter sp. TaxID=1894999 RepID=UPI0026121FA3|nr:thermonuclease family protein [Enhydrobacter sp.]WIM09183.1 MAG: hypothetical protein OJF58_000134 [Enhydrobacter sp.]
MPRRSTLLILAFAALAAAGLAWTPPPIVTGSVSGAVTVVDGDTFRIGRESIRVDGIDAPESGQACADGWQAGAAARHALAGLLAAGRPDCERVTTDRYGRTVAICRVNGEDIGAAMVRRGLAWSAYSVRYLPEEWLARFDGLGVHARKCAWPQDWRALHPH